MAKTLRVIESFFITEVGDLFTLSEDGKFYEYSRNDEFRKADDHNEINSTYSAQFNISLDYAKNLIEDGYLEEVDSVKKNFVNVFDEIESLIDRYRTELANIDADLVGEPQCVKVEKTTVLTNLLSVLNHLKTLRK